MNEIKVKIMKMKDSGLSGRVIADKLNESGLKTSTGMKWSAQKVFNVAYQSKQSGSKIAYVSKAQQLLGNAEALETSDYSDVLRILDNPKYDDAKKVNVARALLR